MSSFLLPHQCPACLARLTCMVFEMGGKWPYSCFFMRCWQQDLFRIAYSIFSSSYLAFSRSVLLASMWCIHTVVLTQTQLGRNPFFILPDRSDFHIIFTNPSTRTEYDTRPTFKRSLTGLNSEFSFSYTSCLTKAEEPSLPYYFPIAGERIIGFIPFPREMWNAWSAMWNAISLVQDLNSYRRVHFLRR